MSTWMAKYYNLEKQLQMKQDELKEDLKMAIRIGLTVLDEDLEWYQEDESRDRLEDMKKKHFGEPNEKANR